MALLQVPSLVQPLVQREEPRVSWPRAEETLMDIVALQIAEAARLSRALGPRISSCWWPFGAGVKHFGLTGCVGRPFVGRSQWPERLCSLVELRLVEEARKWHGA